MQMHEKFFTIDPKKNKRVFVGLIKKTPAGRDYFFKEVNRAEHYFRIPKGYGIQTDVLEQLKNKVAGVLIHEKDTGRRFWSVISLWFKNEMKNSDWGHGKQTILPEKYMEIISKKT